MFISETEQAAIVCEDCYRHHCLDKNTYIKAYKHSVLAGSITPEVSTKICHCKKVAHYDKDGRALSLYPVDKKARHLDVGGVGTIQCSLLKLGESVALAKYNGLQTIVGVKKPRRQSKVEPKYMPRKSQESSKGEQQTKVSGWKAKIVMVNGNSLHDPENRSAASSTTSVAMEAQADQDIPLFFRRFTEKYPFGNVHMGLRVGPLVIENGVSQYVLMLVSMLVSFVAQAN